MAPRQPQCPPRSGGAGRRETAATRWRPAGEAVECERSSDNFKIAEPERVAASPMTRPSAKRRGTDRVARPGRPGSPLRPASPVRENQMPNWQSVVQATQKLHSERATVAAAVSSRPKLSDVDESSEGEFSVQGAPARRRGAGGGPAASAADRVDAAAAALDAELELAASEASGSEAGRRREGPPAETDRAARPEGGGRWAARAAAARRRRA